MAGRLYLFAGGGTGGHLFPGIAVAEELLTRELDARILFVGSDRPIEREILAKTPYEHVVLPSVSLAGAMRHPLQFLRRSLAARREAFQLINQERPAAVIGCGGFASAAPVYAATRRKIPFVLLEQNTIPGRTTRWLCRVGGTVCLSFSASEKRLPQSANVIVTGNPVRREIAKLHPTPTRPTLLVLGGSQGAQAINELMMASAPALSDTLAGWHVVHQTGSMDEQRVRTAYEQFSIDATVAAFFDDMADCYSQASLVISRAGATTLAEIACAQLPAMLLPYPHAADNHQWHNATAFHKAEAALVFEDQPDKVTNSLDFTTALEPLLSDEDRRQAMSASMKSIAHPGAAAHVVDVLHQQIDHGR